MDSQDQWKKTLDYVLATYSNLYHLGAYLNTTDRTLSVVEEVTDNLHSKADGKYDKTCDQESKDSILNISMITSNVIFWEGELQLPVPNLLYAHDPSCNGGAGARLIDGATSSIMSSKHLLDELEMKHRWLRAIDSARTGLCDFPYAKRLDPYYSRTAASNSQDFASKDVSKQLSVDARIRSAPENSRVREF
ncbi:MAG: hypothetical protein Q9218_007049 [Villophora microphyllina]